MTTVPPILKLLAFVGALIAINDRVPALLPRILLLVGLYLVLTSGPAITGLLATIPAGIQDVIGRAPASLRGPVAS